MALYSCGDDFPEQLKLPPAAATNPSPPDSSGGESTSPSLSWVAHNGASVHYDLYLGTDENPTLLKSGLKTTHYTPTGLLRETTYHWRVTSVDPATGDTPGALWTFRTSAGHAPAAPANPSPAHATDVLVTNRLLLQWTASDVDQDTLTYDVYFGLLNDPPLVAENLQSSSFNVEVAVNGVYYWRVVAHDSHGLSTSSRVWWFHTHPTPGHMYNVAGTGTAGFGPTGQLPLETQLHWPTDVVGDSRSRPIIADWDNHRVIGVDMAWGNTTLLAGSDDGSMGDPCQALPGSCTDITAAGTGINMPTQAEMDPQGNLVICAWHNHAVFLLNRLSGKMDRICGLGSPPGYNGDEQPAVTAQIGKPVGAAFDRQGRLCFGDQWNQIIRMIDGSGTIHTIAGTAPTWNGVNYDRHSGFAGDEGPATSATLNLGGGQIDLPAGKICFDPSGNMYIADTLNHAVRVVDTSGVIHRFAGVYPASAGFDGDGGPATSAHLSSPRDVASDTNGNIFIADTDNHVVRVVTLKGVITTVAGVPMMAGDGADAGLATETMLNSPFGISIDVRGYLWIADTFNNRIRIIYR